MREAGLTLLAGNIDFQKDILADPLPGSLLLQNLQQAPAVGALNQIHMAHDLPDLIGLQVADKMDRRAPIGPFRRLTDQLLAAIAACTAWVSFIFVAAHRRISPGSRPQASAASAIFARTRATFS